jgi:hypothetical protein
VVKDTHWLRSKTDRTPVIDVPGGDGGVLPGIVVAVMFRDFSVADQVFGLTSAARALATEAQVLAKTQDGRARREQRQLVLVARVVVDGTTGLLPVDSELRA